jgi:hypothetical protein
MLHALLAGGEALGVGQLAAAFIRAFHHRETHLPFNSVPSADDTYIGPINHLQI